MMCVENHCTHVLANLENISTHEILKKSQFISKSPPKKNNMKNTELPTIALLHKNGKVAAHFHKLKLAILEYDTDR